MEWISVKDELPKENQKVLVSIFKHGKYYDSFTCKYSNGVFRHEDDDTAGFEDYTRDVAIWIPLPELPKIKS
jgi:hypothetical protein